MTEKLFTGMLSIKTNQTIFHLCQLQITSGLFQEKVSGWGGTGLNFFLLGAGVQKVSDFWVGEVKHILVSWVVG